jgi:hypothetical protein
MLLKLRFLLIIYLLFCLSFQSISQPALFLNEGIQLFIGSNVTVYVNGDLKAFNGGDTSSIVNDGILSLTGDVINNGTGKLFNLNTGKVILNGSSLQQVQGNTAFFNLEIDNSSGVQLVDTTELNSELVLTLGNLTTAGKLILNATALKTARIAPILTGSISGDVTIEAFVENQAYDFRFLSMPVQNKTLDEWSDDMLMTGFLGTPFPTFNFNSVYFYDETLLGNRNARYNTATNVTDAVPMAKGVQAYIGASDLKIDVTGQIYEGTIDFGVTYTDDLTQAIEEDGWNLLGNPYPSTIDWNSTDWVKHNINDAIYIYQGSISSYQTYVNGVGTNGGMQYIPSSQAFWVKAIGNPLLIGNEHVKSSVDASFIERPSTTDVLRLRLSNQNASDEIVVRYLPEATSSFDPSLDAYKLKGQSSNPIITAIQDSIEYAILSSDLDILSPDIFIQIQVPSNGFYSLNVDALPVHANCLVLEDLFTGRIENLRDSSTYQFYFFDTTTVARFKLTASRVVNLSVNFPVCSYDSAIVSVATAGANSAIVQWVSSTGVAFIDSNFRSNRFAFVGNQQVTFIANNNQCGLQTELLDFVAADSISISLTVGIDTGFSTGSAVAQVIGGTAPYSFNWSVQGSGNVKSVTNLSSGNYILTVQDSMGCVANKSFTVGGLLTSLNFGEIVKERTTIFPNPVEYELNVLGLAGITHFELLDVQGRRVMQGLLNPMLTNISLNWLNSGLYYLVLKDSEEIVTLKINKN